MKTAAACKSCETVFTYWMSQSRGLFCSNACQGKFTVRRKFINGSVFSQPMRKYLLDVRGLRCEAVSCHVPDGYTDSDVRAFQIDHVNGDRKDNRHENLKVTCAICHCKTSTWGQNNASSEGLKRMWHRGTPPLYWWSQ